MDALNPTVGKGRPALLDPANPLDARTRLRWIDGLCRRPVRDPAVDRFDRLFFDRLPKTRPPPTSVVDARVSGSHEIHGIALPARAAVRGASIPADTPASASAAGSGRPSARQAQASPIAALVWMP